LTQSDHAFAMDVRTRQSMGWRRAFAEVGPFARYGGSLQAAAWKYVTARQLLTIAWAEDR
jgi:hypothetical protein